MSLPENVVPLFRLQSHEEDDTYTAPNVLGMLHRKEFELWVCRSPRGALSLKWWRWREDLGRFFPLEDGELTLEPGELQPLAELLSSVDGLLQRNNGGPAS